MNAAEGSARSLASTETHAALGNQWRALRRAATVVALLALPAVYLWLHDHVGWSAGWAIAGAIGLVVVVRGAMDLVFRRFIPWPSLFGAQDERLAEEDVLNRRRAWFWKSFFRWAIFFGAVIAVLWRVNAWGFLAQMIPLLIIFPFYFVFNFLILLGPMMWMGISQIHGYEPGDATWGVKLDDVRGQAEAKEEVRRIVDLWQSGEIFEEAGGQRERGLLFLGAPGTGKTMLAKAIATGFNSPIITIPGSGFAQAQPLDAKILTPRGWATMGEIRLGDEVIDPEGGTARVVGIFPQGERDIYRVTFSDGSSTECDLDHLWHVRRHRRRPWRVETLGEIKEKLETDSRQNRPYIPLVQNLEFEEQELPLDPYLLGVLLGDGCSTTTTPSLIGAEPELIGASAARLPSGMRAEENRGKPGAFYLTAGKRGRLPNPLTSKLNSLKLHDCGALTKFVPNAYKYAAARTRLEVLRGLMDTDGYVRPDERSEAVFATSSAALADDVVFLVRSLGGTATKRRIGTGSYRHPVHGRRPAAPAWQVQVALGRDCNPFRLARKAGRWTRAWEPSRRMVSIEKVGRKQAQCIKLDSENELYVTDDFVVTHNTFIGIDALMVRYLARKAKRLAAKWGGQCIVFIDEIDAVGTRRSQLVGQSMTPSESPQYFGQWGALNASGDLVVESAAWRDYLFGRRAEESIAPYPAWMRKIGNILNQGLFPGMMGGGMGQLALNQLLVTMDGIDNPPFMRRWLTNKTNTILDASYIIPRRIGGLKLRFPNVRPTGNQIYFIGATNVPLEVLDPALTRPGRMGRHVQFRTPTKEDRKDIFDLYLDRVAHDPELDHPQRRDEVARITNGYAQPLDAKVLTPVGWKRMGDLEIGDLVIGSNGDATPVVGVHPRGRMEVFRVVFNDGTSTECTADHLWTVEALDPRMRARTFTTAELRRRGLRWSSLGSRFYLPKLDAVQFAAQHDVCVDPYLLGVLLGDGGLTSTTPDLCTAGAEILAEVQSLVPAGVEARQHGPMNWWLSSGRRGGPRGRQNPLTARLQELGVWGRSGGEKFIPERYTLASAEDRLALLQGLMDTDGSIDYRRGTGPTFYSHSRRLADDVASLVRSLGGTARLSQKREAWRIAVDLPNGLVPFRLSRKADIARGSRRPFRKRITAIVRVGTKEVRCITVAAANGLYVTDDYIVTHNSPAMIEQVCSMALSNAHHEGKLALGWQDLVDAMTTLEAGTAVGIRYVQSETRAVAIHEAGHAATAHIYRPNLESSRLSIRMRGGSLGHHQAFEKEERFSQWHSEAMGSLVHTLGAMAAEQVFYGENSSGVGGDLSFATQSAAMMVGTAGMGPGRLQIPAAARMDDESESDARERIMRRFEKIGLTLMNRTRGSADFHADPVASVLHDPFKRAQAAQILGQAFVTAHNFIQHNREAVEKVADAVIEKQELFGDDLLRLLDSVNLERPEVDLAKEETWPTL